MKEDSRILIAGGSGFIGKALAARFAQEGTVVHVLSRQVERQEASAKQNIRYFYWNPRQKEIDLNAFEQVETLINLSGANIGEKRWTQKRKTEIFDSRVQTTRFLFEVIRSNSFPVYTVVSASAVGYYGMKTFENQTLSEDSPKGDDFLSSVCNQWEKEALQFHELGTRVVILRQGVVLGKEGGIYQKLFALAKWGINVSLGSGRQYLPWISMADMVALYYFCVRNTSIDGIFNAVADEQVTMQEFARKLSQSLHRPILTPAVPAFVLRLMLGDMSQMLLQGTKVSNRKIRNTPFQFECLTLAQAFDEILI